MPRLGPHNGWLQDLPARLGHSPAIDGAILALIGSLNFYLAGQKDISAGQVALCDYGKCLASLRSLTQSAEQTLSDQVMIAISLIVIFEMIMREFTRATQRNVYSHWSALSTIFNARRKGVSEISYIVKALLFHLGRLTFCLPVANGKPSPFDAEDWDPSVLETELTASDSYRQLHGASHTMRVLHARVISHLTRLSAAKQRDEAMFTIVQLARHIYGSQAAQAENNLLHKVNIIPSHPYNKHITAYSFRFQNSDQLMALVIYWKSRCAAICLCLHITSIHTYSPLPFDSDSLREESERCLMNLIMSWEEASTIGPFASLWVSRGFISAWREIRTTQTWRGLDTTQLRAWLLPKVQHTLIEWLPGHCSERDIDLAADVVAGSFSKVSSAGWYSRENIHVTQ